MNKLRTATLLGLAAGCAVRLRARHPGSTTPMAAGAGPSLHPATAAAVAERAVRHPLEEVLRREGLAGAATTVGRARAVLELSQVRLRDALRRGPEPERAPVRGIDLRGEPAVIDLTDRPAVALPR